MPVAGCVTALGSLGAQRLTRRGVWSSSQGCLSSQRGDSQTRYFAKRFAFTLTADTNIVIALSSTQDSYLYVLNGHSATGTIRARNDDADSDTCDSRIETRLAAGVYTIEATTRQARTQGSFTLTVTTSTPTTPTPPAPKPTPVTPTPVTVTGLSKRYTASVDSPVRVAFSYQPTTARMTLRQPALAGLTLTASHRTGNATVTGTPTRAGVYEATLTFTQPGRADTTKLTIAASCPQGHQQQTDRSCRRLPACITPLGHVSSVDLTKQGTLQTGCLLAAPRQGADSSGYHAKHYTFTLNNDAHATIELSSTSFDAYLYLLHGHTPDGAVVAYNDDNGATSNSKLANLQLAAGDYTIAATSFRFMRTGDFTLKLRAITPAVTTLKPAYTITVGERSLTGFNITPAGVAVPALTPAATPGLTTEIKHRDHLELDGQPSLSLTAHRPGKWQLTIKLTQPGRVDLTRITITAICPTGTTPHINNKTCTPIQTVPTTCQIKKLENRNRIWWGRVTATRIFTNFSIDESDPAGGCASINNNSTVSYYFSFTVPEGAPPARLKLTVDETFPLVESLTLWKQLPPKPRGQIKVHKAAHVNATSSSASIASIALPAGTYITEIARTTGAGYSLNLQIEAWIPLPSKAYADVKKIGNTGLNGAGMTLEEFLETRGSLCYDEHPTCPTDADNPFDPLNPTHPWLPFTTDECSIPQKLIQGIEIWINAMILLHRPQLSLSQLINLRQYFQNNATFGTQTVPFVYACMRHDFNWRNLYRTEHHLKHGDTWNTSVRNEADDRFYSDLKRLCNVGQTKQSVTHKLYKWKLEITDRNKCINVATALYFGVQTWPIILIKYGNSKV
ncbi:MAG: pre-peptidase C-terminal domain-containing protein [Acidimicrobiaceae bacterium]|nr:pre-peptidase C-terminal domain-containing protein [Acidimicrobiaceae bacterium]